MMLTFSVILAVASMSAPDVPVDPSPFLHRYFDPPPPRKGHMSIGMDDAVALEQITQMGPNVLTALIPFVQREAPRDNFGDVRAVVLFQELSDCTPYAYWSNNSAFEGSYGKCNAVPPGEIPELSENMDGRLSRTAGDGPFFLRWWDGRKDFPKTSILSQRLRSVAAESQSGCQAWSACQQAVVKRDVYVYGVYAIPAFIDALATDNSMCLFAAFLYRYNGELYNEFDIYNYQRPTLNLEHLCEAFPTRSDRLGFIRNWWYAVRDTYTSLPELHAEIDQIVERNCPTDRVNDIGGYLDRVPRPDMKVSSLAGPPNIYVIERYMPIAALETALGRAATRVNRENAPDVFKPNDGGSKAIWRWPGTNGLSNYLVVLLRDEGTVFSFNVRHGWLDPGLPRYREVEQSAAASVTQDAMSGTPSPASAVAEREPASPREQVVSRRVMWVVVVSSACTSICVVSLYLILEWRRKNRR